MPVVDAVRLALGSTMPSQRFTVEDDQATRAGALPGRRRRSRPPGPRPRADGGRHRPDLGGDGYSVPSSHSDTTFVTQTTYPAIPVRTLERDGHPSSRHLRESISARSFLALGVPAKHADRIAAGLVELLRRCRGQRHRRAAGVAAGERREGWRSLGRGARCGRFDAGVRGRARARRARGPGCPSHRSGDLATHSSGSPGVDRPVVITEAAPLARYEHMAILSRLADITTSREQAVWLIVPEEASGGPLLDRVPVPLTYASQFVHIDGLFVATEGEAR